MTDVWYIPAAISFIALLFCVWWTLVEINKNKREKDGVDD